jgi:hypothetical protein
MRPLLRIAGHGDARKVAFHVGGEHRHAGARQPLGQRLQRDRLAVPVAPRAPVHDGWRGRAAALLRAAAKADQNAVVAHLNLLKATLPPVIAGRASSTISR